MRCSNLMAPIGAFQGSSDVKPGRVGRRVDRQGRVWPARAWCLLSLSRDSNTAIALVYQQTMIPRAAGILEDGVVSVGERGDGAGIGDLTADCQHLPA